MIAETRSGRRLRRHLRVRKGVSGTSERPRLAVFRSLNHIYVQVIDDGRRETLAAASSLEEPIKDQVSGKPKREVAKLVGVLIAARSTEQGIKKVVFDRGGYRYFGRIQALADAAREGGLEF